MTDLSEPSGRSPVTAARSGGDGDAGRRLQVLAEISRLVTLGLDERAILQHVTEAVTRLLEAPYAGLWMLEAHTGDLVVAATAGPLSSAVQPGLRRPPGSNTLNQVVLARGQSYQTDDVDAHPNWVNHAVTERWGLRTYLGVPLMVGERRFGILTLMSHQPRVFGTEDLELVEIVAAQAAAALANAREYERAAALGKISQMLSSNLEPQAVFEAAVAATVKLLGVQDVRLWLHDTAADVLRLAARAPAGDGTTEVSLPVDDSLAARALRSGRPFVAHDIAADPRWRMLFPPADRPSSGLFVPLVQQDRPLGVIVALSASERAFGEDDLDLLRALASQVSVAIEHARLYEEARERSHQLTTILDVNKRLALGPRLDDILTRITEEAARLLGAEGATLRLLQGDELVRSATYGLGELLMVRERLPHRGTLVGHLIAEKRPILITDPDGDSHLDPSYRAELRAHGLRAWLGVPLRGADRVLGTLTVFSWREHGRDAANVSLLEAFADQAALAIENARLLATMERRATEAAAVAEVGRAITGSLDVQAVLDLIVDQACRLLGTSRSALALQEPEEGGPIYQFVARRGLSDQFLERLRPRHARDGTTAWAIVERRSIWSADLLHDPRFELSAGTRAAVEAEGYRAVLSAPLLIGDRTLGALAVFRDAVGPFSAQEVELLGVFADQAAVALDNARLFQQEQERRRQLEAVRDVTAELTREFGLTTLLQLIVRRAAALVEATLGVVWLWDEASEALVAEAWHSVNEWPGPARLRLGEGVAGTAAERHVGMIVNDYRGSPYAHSATLEQTEICGALAEPVLYQGRLVGVILLGREGSGRRFTEQDRSLLGLFADQAAIAIENARLFEQAATVEALRELARLKAEFLSTASHELRTPLTLIHGYAELLRDRVPELSSAQIAEMAAQVYAGSSTMSRLVDDFLNLSHLEQGRLELRRSRVAVADVLGQLIQAFSAQPGGERITVELPETLAVNLDPDRLTEMVSNLLSNALRYAPEGPIAVRVAPESGRLRVEVADHGPGIPPTEQQRIWEKFYRGKWGTNSPNRGSGLGLPVVKQLAELQGGRVGVHSRLGQGTTFWFTLPPGEPV